MTKKKLTPWFSSSVKPARDGVYIVASSHGGSSRYYSYFDSDGWHGGWWSAQKASENRWWLDGSTRVWRGLASNPLATEAR